MYMLFAICAIYVRLNHVQLCCLSIVLFLKYQVVFIALNVLFLCTVLVFVLLFIHVFYLCYVTVYAYDLCMFVCMIICCFVICAIYVCLTMCWFQGGECTS